MKTLTINGFALCEPAESYEHKNPNCFDGFTYRFSQYDMTDVKGYITAGTATLTINITEGFDPRGGAVKALEEQRKKIQAEFQARMNEIDKQISQFTAIEYAEAA